jgi:DNA polymerase-1
MRQILWRDVVAGDVVELKGERYQVTRRTSAGGVVLDGVPWTGRPKPDSLATVLDSVVFDIETADKDELFSRAMGFVRLCGFTENGESVVTDDPAVLLAALNDADEVIGHNVMAFDLLALARHHGADWEALAAKARDTLLLARLADPPRARDTAGVHDRYDLDATAEKFGVPGKSGSLRALKKKYGGYDLIPVDDPEYVTYLHADVRASTAVAVRLPMTPYGKREHRLASLAGRMSLNGFRVDLPLLAERIEEGEVKKAATLAELAERFGLPLSRDVMRGRGKAKHAVTETFASPLATLEGQAWWAGQVKRFGWHSAPRTPKGKLSTGASELAPVLTRKNCPPELAEIVRLMAIVTQIRTVYGTADDCRVGDRVHPVVSMGQASGRWSVQRPGLTVFGKRGGRSRERDIFLPEEGHVLISCDMSQVDMRGIAGHCQDPAYMALFEPGRDVHKEIALAIFGEKAMDTPEKAQAARDEAKARGHGYNYGLSANAMIRDGADPELVNAFFAGMAERFPVMIAWRDKLREYAEAGNLIDNGFGRIMRCDPERTFTQAPALIGQGTARDLICDALLRLPEHFWPYMRVMVHDELVCSVPEDRAEELGAELQRAFTTTWRNVPILSKLSGPGKNWGELSRG